MIDNIRKTMRGALSGVAQEGGALRAKLGTLERRLQDLQTMPLPRKEVADMVCAMIDESAGVYLERLSVSLTHVFSNPLQNHVININHDEGSRNALVVCQAIGNNPNLVTPKTLERSLCYLFNEQMKSGVRRAIEDMPYPDVVGPPMAERLREIEKCDRDIEIVKKQIEELRLEMDAVRSAASF